MAKCAISPVRSRWGRSANRPRFPWMRGIFVASEGLAFLDELEGWNPSKMAHTVGKMFKGADHLADWLADATSAPQFDARLVRELSSALKLITQAIQSYTGIYQWAMGQGLAGKASMNALDDLFPVLTAPEMRTLETWLKRLEREPT